MALQNDFLKYGEDYFFNDGVIKLKKGDVRAHENTVLYHITWLLARGDVSFDEFKSVGYFYNLEEQNFFTGRSHDNMTAYLSFLKLYAVEINDIKMRHLIKHYKHPRDIIYYGYLLGKWWAYPLLPCLLLMFLHTCTVKYKRRPQLHTWLWMLLKGVHHKRAKIFKTDGEILLWIRFKLAKNHLFIRFCTLILTPLLKWKYGEDWEYNMFLTYYRDKEHPIVRAFERSPDIPRERDKKVARGKQTVEIQAQKSIAESWRV